MRLTVREAMGMEPLTRARVLAGRQGLGRVIKTVTIMDTPDIKNWLVGGEFLLTNVFVIRDDPQAQVALVRDLHERGVAAIGVKLKRFVEALPREMLDLANQLGLPVIEMPVDIAWIEVLHPVLTTILNRQATRLEESGRIHDHFTGVALLGQGLPEICVSLAEITGSPCAVLDRSGAVLSQSGPISKAGPTTASSAPAQPADWKVVFDAVLTPPPGERIQPRLGTWDGHRVAITPLVAGSEAYGHFLLLLHPDRSQDMLLTALEHASTVATLEMVKKRAIVEAERRFRNDFLLDLLSGNVESREAALSRAKSLGGWDFNRPYLILVADLDEFERFYLRHRDLDEAKARRTKEEFQEIVGAAARMASSAAITVEQSDSITVLLPVDGPREALRRRDEAKVFAATIKSQVQARLREVTVSIGIGRFHADVLQWPEAYREARLALEYGRRIWGRDRIIHYDDLGIYRLLLSHGQAEDLRSFADEILGGLDLSEAGKRGNLYQTLETFFQCNRSVRATAEALFVHVNTVRHRLSRVQDLIGFDPENAEECSNLELALRIRTYLANESARRGQSRALIRPAEGER